MSDKLVADLREESRLSQRTAWEQADGGQDYCIAAQLADAAADRIEMQAARIAELEKALIEVTHPDFIWGALDNVHDAETTLDEYAAAVSRAQRAALKGETE